MHLTCQLSFTKIHCYSCVEQPHTALVCGVAHTSNSKPLAGATQLNEMAFAVREATTELMNGKNCTPALTRDYFGDS